MIGDVVGGRCFQQQRPRVIEPVLTGRKEAKTCEHSAFADEIRLVIGFHPSFTLTPTFRQIVVGRFADGCDEVAPALYLSAYLLIKTAKVRGAQVGQKTACLPVVVTKNLGPGEAKGDRWSTGNDSSGKLPCQNWI